MHPERLLAIDPSLTCSGWALFDLPSGNLLGVGKIRSDPPTFTLGERLKKLQEEVLLLMKGMDLGGGDLLICEAPTTMRDPRAALKVEQVRVIFECVARSLGVRVPGRINPRSVQFEVLGLKGKQLPRESIKLTATRVALVRFQSRLKALGFPTRESAVRQHQDIIDALLIGALGLERVQEAIRAGLQLEELLDTDRQRRRDSRALKNLRLARGR